MKLVFAIVPISFLIAIVGAYLHVNEVVIIFTLAGAAASYAALSDFENLMEEFEFAEERWESHRCRPRRVVQPQPEQPDLRKKGRVETTITETRYEP